MPLDPITVIFWLEEEKNRVWLKIVLEGLPLYVKYRDRAVFDPN